MREESFIDDRDAQLQRPRLRVTAGDDPAKVNPEVL